MPQPLPKTTGNRLLQTAKWGFLFLVIAWAIGPWVCGQSIKPSGWDFFAAWPKAPGDAAVYYRYIEQGRTGSPMMIDGFTAEAQKKIIWQPVWWMVGKSAEALNVTTPTIFMIWRLVAAVICAGTIWWASGLIFSKMRTRIMASFLGYFGAGIGGWWSMFYPTGSLTAQPMDVWVSEAFPWLSAWASPHFLLVTSGLIFLLIGTEYARNRWIKWLAGPVMLITISVHPFHLITIVLAWLTLSVYERRSHQANWWENVRRRITTLGWAIPAVLYYGLTAFDAVTWERAAQNINHTSAPWLVAAAIVPLLIMTIPAIRKANGQKLFPLWIWTIVILFSAYIPLPFQRRLLQAIMVPLGFLAAAGLTEWLEVKTITRRVVVAGAVALIAFTPIWVGVDAVRAYQRDKNLEQSSLSYIDPTTIGLIKYLNGHPNLNIVLAGKLNGNILGALTMARVYYGHNVETVDAAGREEELKNFYGTWDVESQKQFVKRNRICAVVFTAREETYGRVFSESNWAGLKSAFKGQGVNLISTGLCD